MEVKATENIIPFHRPMEKEVKIVSWVNQPNILLRNAKAEEYIRICKAKKEDKFETLGYFLGGIGVFALPFAMYILGILF